MIALLPWLVGGGALLGAAKNWNDQDINREKAERIRKYNEAAIRNKPLVALNMMQEVNEPSVLQGALTGGATALELGLQAAMIKNLAGKASKGEGSDPATLMGLSSLNKGFGLDSYLSGDSGRVDPSVGNVYGDTTEYGQSTYQPFQTSPNQTSIYQGFDTWADDPTIQVPRSRQGRSAYSNFMGS